MKTKLIAISVEPFVVLQNVESTGMMLLYVVTILVDGYFLLAFCAIDRYPPWYSRQRTHAKINPTHALGKGKYDDEMEMI